MRVENHSLEKASILTYAELKIFASALNANLITTRHTYILIISTSKFHFDLSISCQNSFKPLYLFRLQVGYRPFFQVQRNDQSNKTVESRVNIFRA